MGTVTAWVLRVGAVLLLVSAVAGCADDSDDGATPSPPSSSSSPAEATGAALDPAALDGASYTSTSVEGHELVPGSAIDLTFEGDTMSVWAGCNTLFGGYGVDGSTLAWSSEPAATMMMCEPELAEQDQ